MDQPNLNTWNDMTANHLILLQCSKGKLQHRAKAEELYTGQLFQKSLRYAHRLAALEAIEGNPLPEIQILSALHGLVDPSDILEPYEKTLNTMAQRSRRHWAEKVYAQLKSKFKFALPEKITFLTSIKYRQPLGKFVREYDLCRTAVPLKGLGIGQQMQFLDQEYFNMGSRIHLLTTDQVNQ